MGGLPKEPQRVAYGLSINVLRDHEGLALVLVGTGLHVMNLKIQTAPCSHYQSLPSGSTSNRWSGLARDVQ